MTQAPATGSELLALLEKAFARHAGGDSTIDVGDLRRALGLYSEYLSVRIFASFDHNGDGYIAKDEFLASVRALVFGAEREKLAFAFRLWDHDGDGFLDREELLRMISLSFAESDVVERVNQPAEQLAFVLLSKADRDGDGRVSFDELEAVARRHPHLLARMTRSEAIWIAPNEELLVWFDQRAGRTEGGGGWLSNRAQQVTFLALWLGANVAVFAWSLLCGRASQTWNVPMQIGRALGACIDLTGNAARPAASPRRTVYSTRPHARPCPCTPRHLSPSGSRDARSAVARSDAGRHLSCDLPPLKRAARK